MSLKNANKAIVSSLYKDSQDFLVELIDRHLFQSGKKQATLFSYFKQEICTWLCYRHDQMLPYLLNKISQNFAKTVGLFITLTEFIIGDKNLRKEFGSKIVENLYSNWSLFKDFWQMDCSLDDKLLLINLLTKSMQIEFAPAKNKESGSINSVAEMFMQLLVDEKTKLNFKCKLLDLLYFFCDLPPPFHIKTYINQFLTQLPLRSKELVKGEDSYNDYVNIIGKILVSLSLSVSCDILSVLVTIICRESEHICDEEVQVGIVSFIKHLESSKQANLIQTYWESWLKNYGNTEGRGEGNEERKYIMFRKVLIVFLENCDKPVFLDFMCSNLTLITKMIDEELRSPDSVQFESMCLNKKNAFEILQLAYKRLYKDEIFSANARLCMIYETEKCGNLISKIISQILRYK